MEAQVLAYSNIMWMCRQLHINKRKRNNFIIALRGRRRHLHAAGVCRPVAWRSSLITTQYPAGQAAANRIMALPQTRNWRVTTWLSPVVAQDSGFPATPRDDEWTRRPISCQVWPKRPGPQWPQWRATRMLSPYRGLFGYVKGMCARNRETTWPFGCGKRKRFTTISTKYGPDLATITPSPCLLPHVTWHWWRGRDWCVIGPVRESSWQCVAALRHWAARGVLGRLFEMKIFASFIPHH